MSVEVLMGDCRSVLAGLSAKSVHCCVTSPPYFGLRDYGTGEWQGGNAACDHRSPTMRESRNEDRAKLAGSAATNSAQLLLAHRSACGKCGAVKVDSQIGLESTPDEFVAQLVAVFREVRRVLRDDGTLWLNLGDSYANDTKWGGASGGKHVKALHGGSGIGRGKVSTGLKAKDLIGIPWRVAFALQADGWFLRQDIIWQKPNPMPESVTDRCTKAHEYIFLFSKSPKYFYDADAIAEPASYSGLANQDESGFKSPQSFNGKHKGGYRSSGNKERKSRSERGGAPGHGGNQAFGVPWEGNTRNKRSVWTVPTAPYSEAHFATFPPALIEPCILASTSARGCCAQCGTGWVRCTDETGRATLGWYPQCDHDGLSALPEYPPRPERQETAAENNAAMATWARACAPVTIERRAICEAAAAVPTAPSVVLDPFGGAGTTGLVADRLGKRNGLLIELNPAYAEMARRRIYDDAPLFQEAAQ